MLDKLFSKTGLGAALIAGVLSVGALTVTPNVAEAKTHIGIWIGIPGFDYWRGPGYYHGRYRHRLSCSEGRRIVDRRGFNSVTAIDCRPRYYHYRARKSGRWYTVRFDSLTARMTYWRR